MNPPDLQRLLVPRTVALIGSGAWTDAVAAGAQTLGFSGELWRVHPTRPSRPGAPYFRSIDELPAGPDTAFIAAPNHEVPAIAAALARRGAGGFVCFSAGFAETATPAGTAARAGTRAGCRRVAVPRPELLRHGQFLRPGRAVARPGRRRLTGARRRADLAERHDCADADVQRPLAADRLPAHRRQPGAPRRRRPDRRAERRSARHGLRLVPRRHQGHREVRPRRRQGTRARQADRRGQVRPHRGRQPHGAQSHRRPVREPMPCSTPTARRPASPAARRCRRSAKR